jgi:hypothetical protein
MTNRPGDFTADLDRLAAADKQITDQPPMPAVPQWLWDAADQFTDRYTDRRVKAYGLVAAAFLAGWEAAHQAASAPEAQAMAADIQPATDPKG